MNRPLPPQMTELGPHQQARYLAKDARTLGELFRLRSKASAGKPAIFEKSGGEWAAMSWSALYDRARRVARGLLDLGVEPGDRIGILGPTRSPWAVFDLGAHLAGVVSFGIYPKQSTEQIRYLLEHSDAKVVFVDEDEELDHVLAASAGLPELRAVVPWTEAAFAKHRDLDARLVSPAVFSGEPVEESRLDEIQGTVSPSDTAIFVYTSGTTGPPKAAMITHANILALLASAEEFMPLYEDDLSFNFLPMAHAAERVLGLYLRVNTGMANAYASSFGQVLPELQEVRPTVFGSVPRIFEKAHAKIHSEVEKGSPGRQRVFRWADAVGRKAARARILDREVPFALALQHAIADRLVFRKIRSAFGGRVRLFIVGAAPIAFEILEFFWGAGLPIYELYGMTELTVVTHVNRPGAVRLGSVGRIISSLNHEIAEDGEILIRGPFVFRGYFKDQEATARTVIDGWLHTGDIGEIDGDGFLKITDRKKHLIITAGGKNLSPANIERAIKGQDSIISQVHAHGDRRNFVSALIAPSPLETLEWGAERGLVSREELVTRTRELMENPSSRSPALDQAMAKVVIAKEFQTRVQEAVRRGNTSLAQVERIRRFIILDRDLSVERGELTPTMKLKRKFVEEQYSGLFDRLYADETFGLSV